MCPRVVLGGIAAKFLSSSGTFKILYATHILFHCVDGSVYVSVGWSLLLNEDCNRFFIIVDHLTCRYLSEGSLLICEKECILIGNFW